VQCAYRADEDGALSRVVTIQGEWGPRKWYMSWAARLLMSRKIIPLCPRNLKQVQYNSAAETAEITVDKKGTND